MAIREFDFEKEPTVSVVKRILNDAIKMKASNVHFDPTEDELIVKFRVNGDLVEYTTVPDSVKINIITRVKILAGMNITESLMPQIGSICIDSDSKTHTMRVSSLPVADGEKLVCHITNYNSSVKAINKLGFNDKDVKKIKDILSEQQGIILVTGSGNSGKTTTIYSILKEINNSENNIISIEDPINMKIKGINQVEICPEKGITYKNVLKNILLQDSNVISINELVDDEIARYALRFSISGCLVVSSLQSKTIYQTIENLIHMDVENYLLGSNLKGIISQRLVKRLCPMCREKRKATDYEKNVIKKILGKDIKELYYPCGCDDCKDGYIGLIPIAEVIKVDAELRHAISNGKSLDLIRNIIYEENASVLEDGLTKTLNGDTSFQEIMRIIDLDVDFEDDEIDVKNLIIGKSDGDTDKIDKDEIVPKKKKKTSKDIGVTDDNDETTDKDIDSEDANTDKNGDKEIKTSEDENVDASEQMEDAKELLNKLMAKSRSRKTSQEADNESSNEDTSNSDEKKEEANNSKSDASNIDNKKDDEKKEENKETPVSDVTENKQGENSHGPEIKKSSFNLDDVDVDDDDDDDFDYKGYDNTF